MTRRQIKKRMAAIEAKHRDLKQEYRELVEKDMLLSDRTQQYYEEEITFGRGKNKTTHLCGFITWKEDFIDEDTGNVITIERNKRVRIDGEWQC